MGIIFKSRNDLIFVVCVSLAAYWIHSVAWPLHPGRDWASYLSVLTTITDGNLFQKHSLVDLGIFGPRISHHPPVTPLLTGFIFFLGGPILLEISLSLAFCFVNFAAYTIASFWGRMVGIIGVIILCLFQPYIHIFHQASSDAIFAALLMLFFFASFRFLHSQNYKTTIVIGLIAFLASFTRTTGNLLFFFWPFMLVLLGLFGLKRFIRHALVFSCICAILWSCWATYFFITVDSFQTNFGSTAFTQVKVHQVDEIFYPENGPASMEISQIIKKNIEEGKYKGVVDQRGLLVNDLESFRTGGNRTLGLLILAPRARYSLEESNRLIERAAVEAIRAHPRRYLRGLIVGLHESLLFGKMLDYTDETSSYAKARAKVRKGLDVSAKERMLALSIRDGNQQLRTFLDSYKLPNMYFWTIAGFGLLIGTVGFAEIVLIGYLLLAFCHIFITTLAGGGELYQYRAPLDPIFVVIGIVGLSKAFNAIKNHEYDAFNRLFRIIYVAVFLASLVVLPFLLFHESRFPEIFGRYSVSSFLILSFDVLIAAGLILSFVGERISSSFNHSGNMVGDRICLASNTYKYISVGLVLCFLTIWLPLAYSSLIDNI